MFNKEEQELSDLIDTGLEAILSGRATLDEVLAEHTDVSDQLRPELESALWISSRQKLYDPRPGFVSASKRRVLERIEEEAGKHKSKNAFYIFHWPWHPVVSVRWAVAIMSLLVVGVFAFNGVMSIARQARPGDQLYPVKRAYEKVTLSVTFDDTQRVTLNNQYSQERLSEVKYLIDKGNYKDAETLLSDFEQNVTETVDTLNKMDKNEGTEKQQLATTVKNDLNMNAEQLKVLLNTAPAEITPKIYQARNTSLNAALQVDTTTPSTDNNNKSNNNTKPSVQATSTRPAPPPAATATRQPANTSVAPYIPPTATQSPAQPILPIVPPTATNAPVAPPANTPIPVYTLTPTAVVPTVTPLPSNTATEVPTDTPVPPTATPVTPTNTPVVPTDTPAPTMVPAGPTDIPPTDTPVPVQMSTTVPSQPAPPGYGPPAATDTPVPAAVIPPTAGTSPAAPTSAATSAPQSATLNPIAAATNTPQPGTGPGGIIGVIKTLVAPGGCAPLSGLLFRPTCSPPTK